MSKKKDSPAVQEDQASDEIVDEVLNSISIRMNHREVDISLLRPNTWNPNQQSDFMYERQGRSLKRFGFIQAVLVRSGDRSGVFPDGKLEIIDGEHRWRKMVELGAKKIVVNDLGLLPDHEAKALTDILNRLRGEDDKLKKAQLLTELVTEFEDLKEVLPYTASDFEEFGSMANFDWGALDDSAPDGDRGSSGGKDDDGELVSFQAKLTPDQKDIVDRAIDRAKRNGDTKSSARALELICADYLAGPGDGSPED